MKTNKVAQKCISCTVDLAAANLIDKYAYKRDLYRSNWLREAVAEKLDREFAAEKASGRKVA